MAKRKILVRNVQRQFNEMIRMRDKGLGCITCGSRDRRLGAGHFLATSSHPSVRFDSRNVWAQCNVCNCQGSGEGAYYYEQMLAMFGQEVIDELKREGRKPIKWSQTRLQRIRDLIKERTAKGVYWPHITVSDYSGEEWD